MVEVDPRAERQPALARLRQLVAAGDDVEIALLLCDLDDAPADAGAEDDVASAQRDYAERLSAWLDAQAAELGGRRVTTAIARQSPRFEAILDEAGRRKADLVMRSARWHSRLERLFVGATDWELIRQAPQTVWLVKHVRRANSRGLNVLAAVDPVHMEERKVGLDDRVLEVAAEIASSTGGALHMMHAWQPGFAIAPAVAASPHVPLPAMRVDADTIERLRGQRNELLGELAAAHGVPGGHVHLVEDAVADALGDLVESLGIDVVVAGGVSRGRLERLIVGNTAEAILADVDCDVVVVKPPSAAGRSAEDAA